MHTIAQPRPRIRDLRKVEEYEDDKAWNTYELPPAEEFEPLDGASADEIIRWVLGRYDTGSAEQEYLELLKLDRVALAELRDSPEYPEPAISAAKRNHNRARYRALVVMSLREEIEEALAAGDLELAVRYGVEEILDCELRFKYFDYVPVSDMSADSEGSTSQGAR
jgi:hypothetical protein